MISAKTLRPSLVRRTSPALSSISKISIGRTSAMLCITLRFPHRQRKVKRAALPLSGFHPDAPAMAFDDLLGDSQADAGSALERADS